MIIALPEKDHGHLADALVRDLGFTRTHVDAPLRDLLLALDPYVDSGVTLANMGPTPRLSSKLEQVGGRSDEERWDRLLHPPRPGASPDRCATEVARLLDVLRSHDLVAEPTYEGDVVVVGAEGPKHRPPDYMVAIDGRESSAGFLVDHAIAPAGVVGEQEAIVAYVKELRARQYDKLPQEYREIAIEHDAAIGYESAIPLSPEHDEPDGRQSAAFVGALAAAGYTSEQIEAAQSGPPLDAAARTELLAEASTLIDLGYGGDECGSEPDETE